MADESFLHSQTQTRTRITDRHTIYESNSTPIETKSRKFRWSSCFSFITKFKKNKSQKISVSQSYEDFAPNNESIIEHEQSKTIQVTEIKPSVSLPWKLQTQPTSSLSPPPRQTKSKRDSNMSRRSSQQNEKCGRRPLVDPTLTPRVKPRSIKTKKQPSLLRLSLDADLLQQTSPDGVLSLDNDYTSPTQPFRSGTLGATRNPKLSLSNDHDVPPLPLLNIPFVTNNTHDQTRPNSQSTAGTNNSNISYIADSPVSVSAVDADEEEKLTLKERRHRKSPLSLPDTEQLTLALKGVFHMEEDLEKPLHPLQQLRRRRQSQQVYYDNQDDDELIWRQQILEQSLAFSFQNKSRHEAMMCLEGKQTKGTILQPIVNFHELDSHFENEEETRDVVKEKAEYDAVVSRTTMHRRQISNDNKPQRTSSLRTKCPNEQQQEKKQNDIISSQLGMIHENEVATAPLSVHKKVTFPNTLIPETPPHHQQNAPSLISAPSTPNSIDSSVFDHEEYHERQLSVILSSG